MTELDPNTFNVEDWLVDAALPEESVTIYKRPDVVAELTELKRQLEIEDRAAGAEADGPTAGSKRPTALVEKYENYLRTFADSALTIYVRALPRETVKQMRVASDERTKDLAPKDANEEFAYDLLAAAIVAVKPAGGEKVPAAFTPEKVKAMENAIGSPQMSQLLAARQNAQNAVPTVDADFLRSASGSEAGQA